MASRLRRSLCIMLSYIKNGTGAHIIRFVPIGKGGGVHVSRGRRAGGEVLYFRWILGVRPHLSCRHRPCGGDPDSGDASLVIPGRDFGANPESIITTFQEGSTTVTSIPASLVVMGSGLRCAAPE